MADKRKRYNQRNNDPYKEYQRLVKNTKGKINRVRNNYGLDLSGVIDIPEYDELDTPEKFDDFVDNMSSFTRRSNLEYQFDKNKWGMVYSKAELLEGLLTTEKAKEQAQIFIDKFKDNPYAIGGKDAGYTVGDRMTLYEEENVAGIRVPKDFDIDAFQSRSRLTGRLELLRDKAEGKFFDESMTRMKENFMHVLRGTFNSEADDLINMIDIIPPDDFFELFLMKAEFTFEDYASDGSIEGNEKQLELLENYVREYFAGEYDDDLVLKGF